MKSGGVAKTRVGVRAKPLSVSQTALARARQKPRPAGAGQGASLFAPALPAPGVLPKGIKSIAMDETPFGDAIAWAQTAYAGAIAEGVAFLGYPYLAELAQRPEYRRISETIASEMTRKWITLSSAGDEDKTDRIGALTEALDRLRVRDAFRLVAEQDGFFGRGHLYLDTDASDERDELKTSIGNGRNKTSKGKIGKGTLKAVRPVEAVWCYPTNYNSIDPLKEDWFAPTTWFCMGKEIHATRLLTFVGRAVPDLLKPAYSFGGLSLSQMAKPYVDNWLRTRQAVADLIWSFSTPGVRTNMTGALGGDGEELFRRMDFYNSLRNNRGLMVLDKDTEEFFNVSVPLSGLDVLQAQTQEHMAAVCGIPIVKLLGIQPAGLNASSDGEIRVFYDAINAYQELLFRAHLTSVIDFVQLSEFGEIDPDIIFTFENLWQLDDAGEAAVQKTIADVHDVYLSGGVVSNGEVRAAVAADKKSPYAGLDLDPEAVPEPPMPESGGIEDPDDPETNRTDKEAESAGGFGGKGVVSGDAEFVEAEHPRDEGGKFTEKGASSGALHSIKPVKARAWRGKATETKTQLAKHELGQLGEDLAVAYLRHIGLHDAVPLHVSSSVNFPLDLVGDHEIFEVKTGIASSSNPAWRITIGQPGKAESLWLKTAGKEEKSAWNRRKIEKAISRKEAVVAEFSEKLGQTVKPKTVALIVDPDSGIADIHILDGFHANIGWNSPLAKENYVGSFQYA